MTQEEKRSILKELSMYKLQASKLRQIRVYVKVSSDVERKISIEGVDSYCQEKLLSRI